MVQDSSPDKEISECLECHESIYTNWAASAHGRTPSLSIREAGGECLQCHTTGFNPLTNTWAADQINCLACHSPAPAAHPDVPMTIHWSEVLCGECHTQTLTAWQSSRHGQVGITCENCHNQHRTSLKTDSVVTQCTTCHKNFTNGSSHIGQTNEGMTCADCHLATLNNPIGEGNARRDHSFEVHVQSCIDCHQDGLHADQKATTAISFLNNKRIPLDAMSSFVEADVSEHPPQMSSFSALAVVVISFGVIGSGLMTAVILTTRSIFHRRKTS